MRKRIKTQEKINIALIGGQIKEAYQRVYNNAIT